MYSRNLLGLGGLRVCLENGILRRHGDGVVCTCICRLQLRSNFARRVSTLSHLASAFNTKPQRKLNLSLRRSNSGLFLIPELQDYAGFYILQQKANDDVESLVKEATSSQRTRNMVAIFDQLSDSLCRVADMADFVRVAHPEHKFSEAAEDTCVKLSGLVERLNTNTAIHNSLKNVLENGDILPMDGIDRRVAELFMFDFEQSGIHLEESKIRDRWRQRDGHWPVFRPLQ